MEILFGLCLDELVETVVGQLWAQSHHPTRKRKVLVVVSDLCQVEVQFMVVSGIGHGEDLNEESPPPLQRVSLKTTHFELSLDSLR